MSFARRFAAAGVWAAALAAGGAATGCGGDGPKGAAATPPAETDDDLPVALAAGLAPTPPMGWNSWNKFGCNVSDTLIKQVADAMVSTGMKDAGYQYINIDDCWAEVARAADGTVQPAAANFPQGIKPVADYVHEKGLKLGIYSDRGTATCGGRAGSEGHELQDAASYAAWGVDYLKYDNCNATMDARTQYTLMRDALAATGRPIVFSLCAWQFYEWGVGLGQLWRTTTDIKDTWASITANLLNNQALAAYAGPNGWNDPDMLEVGNGGMTADEYRAHFALWAVTASPLIAGNDLRGMSAETAAILTNREIIALDQDALGLQGAMVRKDGDLSVWAKPLNDNGARGVVLFNAGETPADMTVGFAELGLRTGTAKVRDLWRQADVGTFTDSYTTSVPAHGAAVLRVAGGEPPRPRDTAFLSDLTWTYATNGLGPVEKDRANGASAAGDGTPLSIGHTPFAKGLGMAAPAMAIYRLGQACTAFTATVGLDDTTNGNGSVVFQVWADGEKLFDSGIMKATTPPMPVQVGLMGKRRLRLLVTNAGDGSAWDRASWGDARVTCAK